jgi:hypothetical protein
MEKLANYYHDQEPTDINDPIQVEEYCTKLWGNSFEVDDEGFVTVEDNLNFENYYGKKLPVKFREVTGGIYCQKSNLATMENFPQKVGHLLNIEGTKITSLKSCPEYVKHNFFCNQLVTSYVGFPKYIKGFVVLGDKHPIPFESYVPVLFGIVIDTIFHGSHELSEILNKGRVDGKMPRELIPTKINQLRNMDARQIKA